MINFTKMETYRNKRIVATMLTGILIAAGIHAQGDEFTRVIEREFPVNEQTNLMIDNIYGNVNIMNHDENTLFAMVPERSAIEKFNLVNKRALAAIELEGGGYDVAVVGER